MFILDLGTSGLRVATAAKSSLLPANGVVSHGVLEDEDSLCRVLSSVRQTLDPSPHSFLIRPPVTALVHAMYRPSYKEALTHGLKRSGFGSVHLVPGAIGVDRLLGQRQSTSEPWCYLDIGEGKLDAAIVSDGHVLVQDGRAFGVDRVKQLLRSSIESTLQIAISEQELMSLLLQLSVENEKRKHHHEVRGKDLRDFSLVSLRLRSEQVLPVLESWLQEVALVVEQLFEQLPSELHTRLLGTGVRLYGGGSQLDGIDQWLAQRIGMHVLCLEQPTKVALRGALL